MFKKLFGWLGNRWVISILGLILVCLLIWFVGPLISVAGAAPLADEFNRLIGITIAVFLWAVINFILLLRRSRANRRTIEDLALSGRQDTRPPSGSAEVDALGERFSEALAILRRARLGGRRGNRYLYQLPWFVMLGPPGAGKSTALRESGLRFPLSERLGDYAVRGVGGTRNCDWWFTEDAVILDTAGRYTTQDSDPGQDSTAWLGFLDLLKRHRRKRPLDGVILTFSASELASMTSEERQVHARAIRHRLQELSERLRLRLPVYLVLTKLDLMAGFVEFFDDLRREDRAQVWGFTYRIETSETEGGPLAAFRRRYDEIVEQLDARLLERLDQERNVTKRGLIYGFPQQIASLREPIREFLQDVFRPSRYESAGFLRGIYLTSGTQEGTPIDRLLSTISARFKLERPLAAGHGGKGRSYFLTRLLRDVIFQEADLVSSTGYWSRNRWWVEYASYAGIAAVAILLSLGFTTSFLGNESLIKKVDKAVDQQAELRSQAVASGSNILNVIDYLNELRDIPGGYADQNRPVPLLMGLGLYQGDKLGAVAVQAYRRGLKSTLLPRLMARLEEQIRTNMGNAEVLYEALKIYLMMGEPSRFNAQAAYLWISTDWDQRLYNPANPTVRSDFNGHVQALFQVPPDKQTLNEALVRQARDSLAALDLAQRIYGQVKADASAKSLKVWDPGNSIGKDDASYFVRTSGKPIDAPVSGFTTKSGYDNYFKVEGPDLVDQALNETWVMGPNYAQRFDVSNRQALIDQVTNLYFQDYINTWQTLLDDLEIRPFRGFGDGSASTRVLGSASSPIKAILIAIAEQVKLTGPLDDGQQTSGVAGAAQNAAQAADSAGGAVAGLEGRVSRLLGIAQQARQTAASGTTETAPPDTVDNHFKPIIALVTVPKQGSDGAAAAAAGGGGAPIDSVIKLIADLSVYYSELALAAEPGQASITASSAPRDQKNVIGQIEIASQREPPPLSRWLAALAQRTTTITAADAKQRVNQVYLSNVAPFCKQALEGRYPINPNSGTDIALDDFARFFAPNGMMDQFFKNYLKPFVDTSVKPWQPLPQAGKDVVSADTLKNFELADEIKTAFFGLGGDKPKLNFQVLPVELDPNASLVTFEVGGQQLEYRHGPQRQVAMQWPDPNGVNSAKLTITSIGSGSTSSLSTSGPWALFRLLDQGTVQPVKREDQITVDFKTAGLSASFELTAGSVINPFTTPMLSGFSCPKSL